MLGDLYGFPEAQKVRFSAFKVGTQENLLKKFPYEIINETHQKHDFEAKIFLDLEMGRTTYEPPIAKYKILSGLKNVVKPDFFNRNSLSL